MKPISLSIGMCAWWFEVYPGRGPWRHLPPPLRPGWCCPGVFWAWRWWRTPYAPLPPVSREDEIRYLRELREYYEQLIKEIDQRLRELERGSIQ